LTNLDTPYVCPRFKMTPEFFVIITHYYTVKSSSIPKKYLKFFLIKNPGNFSPGFIRPLSRPLSVNTSLNCFMLIHSPFHYETIGKDIFAQHFYILLIFSILQIMASRLNSLCRTKTTATMLRGFLAITLRVLWRNKVTSLVNIFSLTIGITTFILIMLYVHHEMQYDQFNENYDRIYRLEGDDYGKLPPIIGAYVKDQLPEVVNMARLAGGSGQSLITYIPKDDPEKQKEADVTFFWADSTTFDVFTLPMVKGDLRTALKVPFTVVLTESTANKLFADTDPIMKTIKWNNYQFMVTGIIRDIKNSHIEIDALLSMESIPKVFPDRDLNNTGHNSWLWSATYLLMADKTDGPLVENKINDVLKEINDGSVFDLEFKRFHLTPLKDIYFKGNVRNLQYGLHGNLTLIRIFFAIGLFMLALACINYINITTARSTTRAKEIAVKRVVGSSAKLLRYQLVLESVIISLISLIVAMTFIQIFLARFNQLAMVDIPIDELNRPVIWTGIVLLGILIGIMAGVYPAIYLSSVKPVKLIKGEGIQGSGGSFFRRSLMTFQFALSIVMITGIIANIRQLHFIRSTDLGFNKEQVITFSTPADIPDEYSLRETFRKRLLQDHDILNVAFSAGIPGKEVPTDTWEIDGIKRVMNFFLVDQDFLDVMGIEMAEGRAFSLSMPGDKAGSDQPGILFNESAVREYDIKSPVGKMITLPNLKQGKIIGIVRDFHFRSLHDKIEPLRLVWTEPMSMASIKISTANISETLKNIKKEWKNVWGPAPFVYEFLDESFDRQYKSDEQLATIIGYFTVLAVIVACMGLFALSSFMVSRRTKEIGIRKTLGASVNRIYTMLSWDFIKWVLLAACIACPLSWYLMNKWLQDFAYHIRLGPDVFIIASIIAIVIAMVTVTWQSLITAWANPVEALRYERYIPISAIILKS
jgi:putative ABC transport system permease protein